jgi:hypothetical protein
MTNDIKLSRIRKAVGSDTIGHMPRYLACTKVKRGVED